MAKAEIKVEQNEKQKSLSYQRDKDKEPVRGIFRFYEIPGGNVSFCYKAYRGDHVEKYSMNDGEIYTIPLGVAKHLNKNGAYPVHQHLQDESGKPVIGVKKMVRRFGFQSLEFIDPAELPEAKPEEDIVVSAKFL